MVKRSRFAVALAVLLVGAASPPAVAADSNWTSAGQNLSNTRNQSTESKLSVATVGQLAPKWTFTAGGEVSATPAVDGTRVYFPDWAGNLFAVDRSTGQQVWKSSIAAASGVPGDRARATPAIADGKVLIGTQGPGFFGSGGGKMLAFDKNTGALLWSTVLDSHVAAAITQSATVYNGRVLVGVSSVEEGKAALLPGYPCCTFRGSMTALDLDTGQLLWKTYMAPEGYPGGAVWGSSPAVDPSRGQVYIGTGNNYDLPDSVLACVAAANGNEAQERLCLSPENHIDAVLALDLLTGAITWSTPVLAFDAWTVQCIFGIFPGNEDNCPEPAGPDYDFGQAPALFSIRDANGRSRDVIGAGQKSGQYWVLDRDTGVKVREPTVAGPGGTAGGLQWGSAVDGQRIYTANANSDRKPWPPFGDNREGVWSGIDARTGALLWQTRPPHGGGASGPATTANGVVFGCALDAQGYMYALNGATGAVLWEFPSGGSCLSGAAISRGTVFWGSGYTNLGPPLTTNDKLYAFAIP
jgi:polyvinyl alcohol dehydrogenase (cytochrome)